MVNRFIGNKQGEYLVKKYINNIVSYSDILLHCERIKATIAKKTMSCWPLDLFKHC